MTTRGASVLRSCGQLRPGLRRGRRTTKDTLDRAFQIGIIAKGLNGLADSESGGNRRPIGLSRVSVTSHPPVSPRAMGPNMTGRGQTWKAGIVLTAHAPSRPAPILQ